MSSQTPSPPTTDRNEYLANLAEDMSDADMSGAEENSDNEEAKDVLESLWNKRTSASRRGTQDKKAKKQEALMKLYEAKREAHAAKKDDSSLSEAGKIITGLPVEPVEPHNSTEAPAHVPAPTSAPTSKDVPVLAHYRRRIVPGPNNVESSLPGVVVADYGLFATQNIEPGTRIIWEEPLITLPGPGFQIVQLMEAFEALEAHDKDKIWSLKPADASASELLTHIANHIVTMVVRYKEIVATPKDERTQEENDMLNKDFARLGKAADWYRIAARWHLARYSLVDLAESERDELPQDMPITGLFVETARLRHSCVPTCFAKYNPTTNRMTVHTMKPISQGEELTLCAIPSAYYYNAASRAAELQTKFGMTCTCEACNPSHPKFAKHEAARLAIYTRAVQLEHFCTLIDIIDHNQVCDDLCLRGTDLVDPDEEPSLIDLRDSEASILALIKNLKDTGCQGPELIRWYNVLIDRIQPRVADALDTDDERVRWWRIMSRHAIECEKIAIKCFGPDSDEALKTALRKTRIDILLQKARDRKKTLDGSKEKLARGPPPPSPLAKMEKKQKWEIVATTGPLGDEEQLVDKHGDVVATLGRYKLKKK